MVNHGQLGSGKMVVSSLRPQRLPLTHRQPSCAEATSNRPSRNDSVTNSASAAPRKSHPSDNNIQAPRLDEIVVLRPAPSAGQALTTRKDDAGAPDESFRRFQSQSPKRKVSDSAEVAAGEKKRARVQWLVGPEEEIEPPGHCEEGCTDQESEDEEAEIEREWQMIMERQRQERSPDKGKGRARSPIQTRRQAREQSPSRGKAREREQLLVKSNGTPQEQDKYGAMLELQGITEAEVEESFEMQLAMWMSQTDGTSMASMAAGEGSSSRSSRPFTDGPARLPPQLAQSINRMLGKEDTPQESSSDEPSVAVKNFLKFYKRNLEMEGEPAPDIKFRDLRKAPLVPPRPPWTKQSNKSSEDLSWPPTRHLDWLSQPPGRPPSMLSRPPAQPPQKKPQEPQKPQPQISVVESGDDEDQCPQCLKKCHLMEALAHIEEGCEVGAEMYQGLLARQIECEAELERKKLASQVPNDEEATKRREAPRSRGSSKQEYEGRARVRLFGQGATVPCPLCKDDYLYSQGEVDDHWIHGCATVLERDRGFATQHGRRTRSPPRASKHKLKVVNPDQEVSESSSRDTMPPTKENSEPLTKASNDPGERTGPASGTRMDISNVITKQATPLPEASGHLSKDAEEQARPAPQASEGAFKDAVEHIQQVPATADDLPTDAAEHTIPALEVSVNTSEAATRPSTAASEAPELSLNSTAEPIRPPIRPPDSYLRPNRSIDRIEELEYINLAGISTREERRELRQHRKKSDRSRASELQSRIQQARQLQEHRDAGGVGYPFLWTKEVCR